tara:strand:+ start:11664 stop:12047 length:384 start_codon:yes stop_codon:yes gene_type:complete
MNSNKVISLPADTALTAHTAVRLTDAGTVETAAAASTAVIGTALTDCADGDAADILLFGSHPIQYITASGAIALGAAVKLDAGGKVQDYAGSGTPIGNALQASAADGNIIRVLTSKIHNQDDAAAAS